MLGIALFVFGWVHVSKHVHGLSALGRTIEQQNAEIAGLTATIERIQTLKSMQVDLRLKLFGEQAIPISMATTRSPAAILSGDVLAAARKANVEFAAMDPAQAASVVKLGPPWLSALGMRPATTLESSPGIESSVMGARSRVSSDS